MKRLVTFSLLFLSLVGSATPDRICVRNYIKDPKVAWDPCQHTNAHVYAVPLEATSKKICTRAYDGFYCDTASHEYVWIHTPEGKRFCTLDYNQPGVTNYCESASQFYDYVKNN